jgi:hypothetical protein
MKTAWTEAGSEFSSGMAANAVRKARSAKARGDQLLAKLEMTNS